MAEGHAEVAVVTESLLMEEQVADSKPSAKEADSAKMPSP